MLHASLRRSGGSLIMTIPQAYAEQNHLHAGDSLALEIVGESLLVKPARSRPRLADLLAQTPEGLCRIDGWDEQASLGSEW